MGDVLKVHTQALCGRVKVKLKPCLQRCIKPLETPGFLFGNSAAAIVLHNGACNLGKRPPDIFPYKVIATTTNRLDCASVDEYKVPVVV